MLLLNIQTGLFRIGQVLASLTVILLMGAAALMAFYIAHLGLIVDAGPDAPTWTRVWLVTAFGGGGFAVVFAALLSLREILRSDVPRSITRAKSRLRREARYQARRDRNMIRLRTILHC